MKKVFLLLFLITVFILPLTAEGKPIITVLDFGSDGVSESEMKSIINFLSSSLFKTGAFTVIDVSQRENILNELEFSMSGCTDESCYLEVGKLLSAEGIVVGSIGRVGSRILLTAKLLETETGATQSSADGMYKDLDELLDDIGRVAQELGVIYAGSTAEKIDAENSDQIEPPLKQSPEDKISEDVVDKRLASDKKTDDSNEPEASNEINFPAWGSLAGAVGCLGTGAYFLAVSLPLVFDYLSAQQAYDAATEASAAAELYLSAESARSAAVSGNVNIYVPLGAGLTAAGIGLGVLSAILFTADSGNSEQPVTAAVYPVSGGMQVSVLLHSGERF